MQTSSSSALNRYFTFFWYPNDLHGHHIARPLITLVEVWRARRVESARSALTRLDGYMHSLLCNTPSYYQHRMHRHMTGRKRRTQTPTLVIWSALVDKDGLEHFAPANGFLARTIHLYFRVTAALTTAVSYLPRPSAGMRGEHATF
jgi:hypothetical protein